MVPNEPVDDNVHGWFGKSIAPALKGNPASKDIENVASTPQEARCLPHWPPQAYRPGNDKLLKPLTLTLTLPVSFFKEEMYFPL